MTEIVRARVDAAGRLVSGDARLLTLNVQAGGAVGEPLAVPQLAAVVQLAATIRMPLSRDLVAADGEHDIDLSVHAVPFEDGGVDLSVTRWVIRLPRSSWLASPQASRIDNSISRPWRWRTDARLNLLDIEFADDDMALGAREKLIGQPLLRVIRLLEDSEGALPILTALADGEGFSGQSAVRRDLPEVEIELAANAVHDSAANFAGFEGSAGPLRLAVPTVEPLSDALGPQLAQMLRRPIDRIVTRADTIGAQADGPLRRDYAEYARDIAAAGRHLIALVDDLADLQAVEQADFRVEGDTIDLADIARRAAGLLGVRASNRGIRIDRPDAEETLDVQGDFRRTLQILVNLIGNAVRYSPEGGMVWIRTESDADTAVVIVADQGKGVAAADHQRIFEKFERVDPSEQGGSGLGLYISRRLARAMGGDITIDSAPGQGARFALTLPIAR